MKKVLITGGTRGIGLACVEKFAEQHYEVIFFYKNSEEKANFLKDKYENVYPIRCDVSLEDEVNKSFERIFKDFGDIDVLVNNAGVSYSGLLQDMSVDEWKKVIDNNLTSVFLCSKNVIPSMVKKQKGVIINVSSMWGIEGASCEVAYSASKAGVIGFTKALAMELAPMKIRVNSVAPGAIKTDMLSSYSEDELNSISESTPLLRLGLPNDIAEAVYFLASDRASFITGEVLNVNGGYVI